MIIRNCITQNGTQRATWHRVLVQGRILYAASFIPLAEISVHPSDRTTCDPLVSLGTKTQDMPVSIQAQHRATHHLRMSEWPNCGSPCDAIPTLQECLRFWHLHSFLITTVGYVPDTIPDLGHFNGLHGLSTRLRTSQSSTKKYTKIQASAQPSRKTP